MLHPDLPKAGSNQSPYGTWKSPITSDLVAGSGVTLYEIFLDGATLYWVEGRPQEGGRSVLVRRNLDGTISDVTAAPFNVRNRVHEMGGGAALAAKGIVYFSHFADNRLYRQEGDAEPKPIAQNSNSRYAEPVIDHGRNRLICVREDHKSEGGEPVNLLVSIPLNGAASEDVLVSGADFYSTPRISPDGQKLSWLSWNHPNMPWMGTELWVGEFDAEGKILGSGLVAGSDDESIFQPEWSPNGTLTFVSDRNGWWNFYREKDGKAEAILPMEAEFARAQWVLGMSTYGFVSETKLVCCYVQQGVGHLAVLNLTEGSLTDIDLPYTEYSQLRVSGNQVFVLAGGLNQPTSLVQFDLATSKLEVVRRSIDALENATVSAYLSYPRFVEFPSGNRTAFAWYYPPTNPDYQPLPDEKPPIIVKSHGGPTSCASSALNLRNAYWTSRGYAVVDVDYSGSTGYGRSYRNRLHLQWGIVDVEDCANVVKYLAAQGWVDGTRAFIMGGSAGGYATLCALVFGDTFRAGASYYGISDLEVLVAEDTHKFESRYTDWLIGKYPEKKETYRARSPIHFTERLSAPIIFFQGEDDKIVPPNQAELMVEALRSKGLPVSYLLFKGEGHGFRRAENISRALDAEFDFYTSILFPKVAG